MSQDNLIDELKQEGKFTEVQRVIGAGLFYCVRNDREFRVEITDSGDANDQFRFMVKVFNEHGTRNMKARGNGGQTISEAIAIVHWSNLEMDENCGKD
jgi:hypothetical protein